jgi:hypothetical protein
MSEERWGYLNREVTSRGRMLVCLWAYESMSIFFIPNAWCGTPTQNNMISLWYEKKNVLSSHTYVFFFLFFSVVEDERFCDLWVYKYDHHYVVHDNVSNSLTWQLHSSLVVAYSSQQFHWHIGFCGGIMIFHRDFFITKWYTNNILWYLLIVWPAQTRWSYFFGNQEEKQCLFLAQHSS